MKSFKLLLLATALGTAVVSPTFAQDDKAPAAEGKKGGRGGQMTPEAQVARLEEAVGTLTAEQKTKITAIYAKAREEIQNAAPEERREKMTKIRSDVRAVLTADQQKKFDEMPQGRGGPGGGGGQGGKKKKDA